MHPCVPMILLAGAAALVGGCGGAANGAASGSGHDGAAGTGAVRSEAAVGAGLSLPDVDVCTIVAADDVARSFGGDVVGGTHDASGGCAFSVSGDTVLGELAGASVDVHVLLASDADRRPGDDASGAAHDLEAIEGLGDGAWYTAYNRELHIDLDGTDLVVIGAPGDAAAGREAVLALGRAILTRLDSAP